MIKVEKFVSPHLRIKKYILSAKANKKLKKGLGIDFAADVLMNTLYGIRVNSRSGREIKQLKMLVKHSIDSLKK